MNAPLVHNPPPDTSRELSLLTPCDREEDVKVVLAGHSHCTAIFEAMVADDNVRNAKTIARRIGLAGLRGNRSDPVYWSNLIALAPHRTIVICWLGNQFDHFFFSDAGVFDFYCRSRPDDPMIAGASVVPEEMVRAHFRATMDDLVTLIGDLRAASAEKIVVLGTPATRGEEAELRRLFSQNPLFLSATAELGYDVDTVPLTPLSVKVKLWAVVQDLLREVADAHADAFVPSPAESCLEDGTLKMKYWLGDGVHGNYEYGCLVVEELAKVIAAEKRASDRVNAL